MKPISFPEQNMVFKGAPGSGVRDLPAHNNGNGSWAVYELSPEDIAEIQRTGRIYFAQWAGFTFAPITLQVENPFPEPFVNEPLPAGWWTALGKDIPLPEYVKCITGWVGRVVRHFVEPHACLVGNDVTEGNHMWNYSLLMPATKEEYDTYIKYVHENHVAIEAEDH